MSIISNFYPSGWIDGNYGYVSGIVPLDVLFINTSIGATDYYWEFGDGETSNEFEPTHTYTIAQEYNVRLTAVSGIYSNVFARTGCIRLGIGIDVSGIYTDLNLSGLYQEGSGSLSSPFGYYEASSYLYGHCEYWNTPYVYGGSQLDGIDKRVLYFKGIADGLQVTFNPSIVTEKSPLSRSNALYDYKIVGFNYYMPAEGSYHYQMKAWDLNINGPPIWNNSNYTTTNNYDWYTEFYPLSSSGNPGKVTIDSLAVTQEGIEIDVYSEWIDSIIIKNCYFQFNDYFIFIPSNWGIPIIRPQIQFLGCTFTDSDLSDQNNSYFFVEYPTNCDIIFNDCVFNIDEFYDDDDNETYTFNNCYFSLSYDIIFAFIANQNAFTFNNCHFSYNFGFNFPLSSQINVLSKTNILSERFNIPVETDSEILDRFSSLDYNYGLFGESRTGVGAFYFSGICPTFISDDSKYRINFINQNLYPYKLNNDYLLTKVEVYKNNKLSYRKDLPVEIYFNYSGSWIKQIDNVTNEYGVLSSSLTTSGIPNINNCLGRAKVTIDNNDYYSDLARFNFIQTQSIEEPEEPLEM